MGPIRSLNASGWVGVTWEPRQRKWCATLRVKGQLLHLGSFTDREAAIAARVRAQDEHLAGKRT